MERLTLLLFTHIKGGCVVSTSSLQPIWRIQRASLDICVGWFSLERVNPHLEGPLSHDYMQGSENTGSNTTSNLKMSKFKRAFTKSGIGRALNDNDWDSGKGIRHSTEGGMNQEPLVSISPPNPKVPTSTHYTLHNRFFLALHFIAPFILRKMLI